MKKIFKPLIPLACITLLGLGFIGYPLKSIGKEVKETEQKTREVSQKLNIFEAHAYISYASQTLEQGPKQYSLFYLEKALGENPQVKQIVTLEELAETAEKVVDKYIGNRHLTNSLRLLAHTLYEEQKKEIVLDKLKYELENNHEMDHFFVMIGVQDFNFRDYANTHLWLVYNMNLNETNSIKQTHQNVRDYYKTTFLKPYADLMMTEVEKAIPKGNSELINKIENYQKN